MTTAPDSPAPDGPTPDGPAPGSPTPDGLARGGSASDGPALGSPAPDGAAPQGQVPAAQPPASIDATVRAPLWWPGIVTAGGLLTAGVLAALGAAFPLVDFADEGPAAGLATGGLDDPGPDDPGFGMDVTGPDDAGFGGMSGEVPFEESLWSGPGPGASDLPGAFGLVPLDSWLPVTAGAVLTLLAGLIAVFAVARTGHAVVTATRVAAALSTGVLVTGSFLVLRSVFSLTAWFGALGAELGNPLPSPSAGAGAILLLVASVVALVGMVLSWGPVPRRTIGGAFPGIAPHPPLATEPRQLPKEDDQ